MRNGDARKKFTFLFAAHQGSHIPNPRQALILSPFPQFVDNRYNPYFCRLLKNRF